MEKVGQKSKSIKNICLKFFSGIRTNKYLLLRRTSQISIILLFIYSPIYGFWILKGSLASSELLQTIPLSDPFILLQSFFANFNLAGEVIVGGMIVSVFYSLVGGRVYCSWVCPVNIVTDSANWLRNKLNLKSSINLQRKTKFFILAAVLLLSWIFSALVWEYVNPVSISYRGLIFGFGSTFLVVVVVFLFDLFVLKNGWCGHLCPVGAFFSLLNKFKIIKINAVNREQCNDCLKCYKICPEPHVIKPALNDKNSSLIKNIDCNNCGRCIDICSEIVFKYSIK